MSQRLLATAVLLFLGTTASFAQPGYKIDVEVAGFQGEQAFLAYYYGDKQYIKDTVASQGGRFTFQGEEALDGGIYLVVLPPKNNYFEIIVDSDQHFSLRTDTTDMSGRMKIAGSVDNTVFYEDLHFLAQLRKDMEAVQERFKATAEGSPERAVIQAEIDKINASVIQRREDMVAKHPDMLYSKVIEAMREPTIPEEIKAEGQEATFYWYRGEYLRTVDFQDPRLIRTPVLWNKVNTYLENLTVKSPDSLIASADMLIERARGNDDLFQFLVINILNKYAQSKIMGMDAVYVHLVERYYMSGDAFWADEEQVNKMAERALAISPTIIGRKAPDFRVQDTQGTWKTLHGVEATYTILYFWDYDCGHCKKVTPELGRIFPEYLPHGVKLFAVSINGDVEVWKQKVQEYGLSQGINVQDHRRQSGFDAQYDIRSTPRIFILDADKKIIAKQIGVEQVREVLDHHLGIERPETEPEASAADGE